MTKSKGGKNHARQGVEGTQVPEGGEVLRKGLGTKSRGTIFTTEKKNKPRSSFVVGKGTSRVDEVAPGIEENEKGKCELHTPFYHESAMEKKSIIPHEEEGKALKNPHRGTLLLIGG